MKYLLTFLLSALFSSVLIAQEINELPFIYNNVFKHNEDFPYNDISEDGYGIINDGVDGISYPIFRLPTHIITKHSTILIASNAELKTGKKYDYATVLARSTDGGKTFEKRYIMRGGLPSFLYDRVHDRIFLFDGNQYIISEDDGVTWSSVYYLKDSFPDGWSTVCVAQTTGIQLTNGILAIPVQFFRGQGKSIKENRVAVLYSKDFGQTWAISPLTPANIIANETAIVEYLPNQVMLNSRGGTEVEWGSSNPGRRVFVPTIRCSSNLEEWNIEGWSLDSSDKLLKEPICHASIHNSRLRGFDYGLFCNPRTQRNVRDSLTLQMSKDYHEWTPVCFMTPKDLVTFGYSSIYSSKRQLTFVYEDIHNGIMFCDITQQKKYLKKIYHKRTAKKKISTQ